MTDVGLTVGLQQSCVRVLIQCQEFKDRSTLETLFTVEPLIKYVNKLPLEAGSRGELIEVVISRLFDYRAAKGQPLLDLLIVLRDRRDEEEEQKRELDDLYKQISFYLSSRVKDSDTTAGSTEQKESTKELRAAIRNYELGDQDPGATSNSEADAASWIAQVYEQPGEWAFRIGLAVFNGASWDACMEASLELARCLSPSVPATTAADDQPSNASATLPRSPLKLLEEANGRLESAGSFRVVKLKESHLPKAVLDYVWDEYTRRELLIEWLSGLVVSSNPISRIRAAVAAGLLALTNFHSIQKHLFFKWTQAKEDRRLYRTAIGLALGVVAEEGGRLVELRNLLKNWAASPDQALRWAAARAYIYVGWRCPVDEVLAQWQAIADAEEVPTQAVQSGRFYGVIVNHLHMSLMDAMERFFVSAAEMSEVRRAVFEGGVIEFKRWADEKRATDIKEEEDGGDSSQATIINFGLLMFIKLARILVPSSAEPLFWPPVLLTLVEPQGAQSPYRKCLVEMFERMLRDPAAQPTALDLLQTWMERVEHDLSYEAQMRALLDDLLARDEAQGEMRRLLAVHLRLWSPRSRFPLREPHPDLSHLQHVVLVVDNSQSALPFWTEVKSTALELGSALSEQAAPQVYTLNNGQAQTLTWLDDLEPTLTDQQTSACSLLAPVVNDLEVRQQQIDALILIGNGEFFDLADWLGHPLIDRWVLVRAGPDTMRSDAGGSAEEVDSNSATAVYDRLRLPATKQVTYPRPTITPAGNADGQWRIDRSGYPLVCVEPLQSYVQLFPVTKAQFERFIAAENQSGWGDEEYAEVLKLNPRVSYRAANQTKYEQLFVTAIKPEEVKAFGRWLGDGYELPEMQQWLTCYDWLEQQPLTAPPPGLAEDALTIWQTVLARQSTRTLLGLSLMCEGVKEWVKVKGKIEKHGGLGCPSRRFNSLSRDPRKLVTVTTTEDRLKAYGFRLLTR